MSYHTWIEYGYGFCVDDIHTTPDKLLKLAAMRPDVLRDVRSYLNEIFPDGYKDEDLTMENFNDLEGDYCEYGLSYVLYNVINDLEIIYANDYNGTEFILYTPTYPWHMHEEERNLTQDDVKNIFMKYISVLTDNYVPIIYYSVENGG